MKKRKQKQKKQRQFFPTVFKPSFLGFPLVEVNNNQLWRWDDLSTIKLEEWKKI